MHPAQMYGWSPQPSPPHRRPRAPGGLRHQLVLGLALLTLGLLTGLTRSSRGLLAIALAWVVVGLLARHRDDGGTRTERFRLWAKALIEYATVGALVVAVMTAAAPAPQPKTKAKPTARRKPPATKQVQDPLKDARAWLAEWRERLPRVEVTTTKEGR